MEKVKQHATSVVVAATCQDDAKLEPVLGANSTDLQRLYRDMKWKLRLTQSTREQKRKLKESIGSAWQAEDAERFATLGAIVMADAFDDMRQRWTGLPHKSVASQDALRAMKLLDKANLSLTFTHLQTVLRGIFDREVRNNEMRDCLRVLTEQSFLRQDSPDDVFEPEPAYLSQVVTYDHHSGDPTKDFPALIPIFEESKDVDALLMFGRKFLLSEEADHARECFAAATRLDATIPAQLFDEASRLSGEKRYQDALEIYDYLLLLNPDDAEAWHSKGPCL